jgi:hypothetical protein
MKKLTLLTLLIGALLFAGCSKPGEEVVANNVKVARMLTGLGNRYWHLREIYIDNVMQTLTDYQKTYTKTYTINVAAQAAGTFKNSDNLDGIWTMDANGTAWEEKFTSNGGAQITLTYTIKSITEAMFDASYVSNGKNVREVYYAY